MDITSKESKPSKGQMKTYMREWANWMDEISKDGRLADGGNHFSIEGRVLKPNNEIVETPHVADNNSVAGYILVLAKNMEEATKIAKKCPILNGEDTSVEIRETASPGA